jgi:hypothetical protein
MRVLLVNLLWDARGGKKSARAMTARTEWLYWRWENRGFPKLVPCNMRYFAY